MSTTTRQASPGPTTRSKAAVTPTDPPTPVTPRRSVTSPSFAARRIDTSTPAADNAGASVRVAQVTTTAPSRIRSSRTTNPPTTRSVPATRVAPARKVTGSRRAAVKSRAASKRKVQSRGSGTQRARQGPRGENGDDATRGDDPSDPEANGHSEEADGDSVGDANEAGIAAPGGGDGGSDGGSDGGEPDGESDGGGEVDHRLIILTRLPPGGKPNPKSLSLRQFTGKVKPGDFDSGVRLWCAELESQLLGAQMRDGHRWNEQAKLSILQNFLAEEPAVWFYGLWAKIKELTVKTALKRLQEKYATKIGEDTVRDLIRQATRKSSESYESYAQRLESMANALPGGLSLETNTAAALAAFVRMACPTLSSQLHVKWAQIQRRKTPARAALREMVDFISLLDRSNGVAVKAKTDAHKSPAKTDAHKSPVKKKAKGKAGKAMVNGVAAAVVTERKRKVAKKRVSSKTEPDTEYVRPEWVTESTKCYACHGVSHLSKDPERPKFARRRSPLMSAALDALEEDSE